MSRDIPDPHTITTEDALRREGTAPATQDVFTSSKPTTLGAHVTQPTKELETFPNPAPGNDYEINISSPEFTANCPKTGQPDFATITLRYCPNELCVELKSFKLYLWSFRNEGHFHEDVTNRILNDLVAALQPKWMEVVGDFNVRGGVKTVVTARYADYGYAVPPKY